MNRFTRLFLVLLGLSLCPQAFYAWTRLLPEQRSTFGSTVSCQVRALETQAVARMVLEKD